MGAVLHTLNLRLIPDQIAYIAYHAEDKVVIVSDTLSRCWPRCCRWCPLWSTWWSSVTATTTAASRRLGHRAPLDRVCWTAGPTGSTGPTVDENDAARCATRPAPTGHPKGVAYSHRSIYLHSMQVCMAETFG
jgi:fatty-acyl-CoA synthase